MSNSCDGIEVGQIWERKTDGVRIRITVVDRVWRDITYRRVENSRKGDIFTDNLRKSYALVEGATP